MSCYRCGNTEEQMCPKCLTAWCKICWNKAMQSQEKGDFDGYLDAPDLCAYCGAEL